MRSATGRGITARDFKLVQVVYPYEELKNGDWPSLGQVAQQR